MTRRAHSADVVSAIAEPRRREVILVLSDGQKHAVNEIALRMKMSEQERAVDGGWNQMIERIRTAAERAGR
jgi:DNA-binding transcriptional ArsR family regulator